MADTVTLIYVWEHFQAVQDGKPLIGGKLYTYAAETSTPKASYVDAFFVTANTNPVILDDQGAATVWLNGSYHLRLTDPEDVLVWDVPIFAFASGAPPIMPGDIITGSTDATVSPLPGESTITVPGLAAAGYRVKGLTYTVTEEFGTSNGLTGLLIGDAILNDRWATMTTLTAGQTNGQLGFHDSTEPIAAPAGYVVLISALNGTFDTNGEIHVCVYWESLPADVP
jgi:hypothetical protein